MSSTDNARTRMLAAIVDKFGWEPDPIETVKKRYSSDPDERVQDPHAFRKAAKHGGYWRIHLDYSQRGGSWLHSTVGNTLRGVSVYWSASGQHQGKIIGNLKNSESKRWIDSWLWEASADATGVPMKKHAETFLTDPDLVIWLAAELAHLDRVQRHEELLERQRIDRKRARLLPIEGLEENGQWRWGFTGKFQQASNKVIQADGISELPRDLADMVFEAERLVALLTPEARKEYDDHMAVRREVAELTS